jgi:SSS family solute:Na+ symporter
MSAAVLTVPISAVLKFLPVWTNGAFPDYPFLDRMTITFVVVVVMMVAISLLKPKQYASTIKLPERSDFNVNPAFIIMAIIITGVLTALYTVYW